MQLFLCLTWNIALIKRLMMLEVGSEAAPATFGNLSPAVHQQLPAYQTASEVVPYSKL